MVVYPIRPTEQKEVSERCPHCERKYTKMRKPIPTIVGSGTSEPVFDWECTDRAEETAEYLSKYPPALVFEDSVNWRGDYWERPVRLSETRYKKAVGEWVPEGYETVREEVHRIVATNALENKFNEA